MAHKTDTPATASHKSMAALLIRLGADPDEAYNATEAMTSEAKRVALELVEQSKLQVLSRIEALHVALKGFKAEVETRFEAVDRRFESIERETRTGFKAIDQRFDGMERRFDKMEQRFDSMQAQFDGHLASYRKLLLLLVVPVAVAITAGIGGMIWKAVSGWATGLP
ncbi:MAG: hypothetical protein F4Y47_02930 [Acidobacteriia bacterium]|nr:hypothetical protein [Terriglobia bacterium]MYG04710.1 hypothetical protein [Terriglobia bacterium]MYK10683.1 hypothetical protein [Terriglobia bacterium]